MAISKYQQMASAAAALGGGRFGDGGRRSHLAWRPGIQHGSAAAAMALGGGKIRRSPRKYENVYFRCEKTIGIFGETLSRKSCLHLK